MITIGIVSFWICILFVALAGVAEAVMDYLQFHYRQPNKFWNPNLSWANKWKVTYNKGLQVVLVGQERFKFSSSLLVFLTDGWHLMKWCRNQSLLLTAVSLCPTWQLMVLVTLLRILYGVVFHLTYNNLK